MYEPPIGEHGSNPEATLIKRDGNTELKVNIEVKTPGFPLLNPDGDPKIIIPNFLLSEIGKEELYKISDSNGLKPVMPRIHKLVDFINSATKKFSIPQKNEFNLLYINWSYSNIVSNSFLEPFGLLFNEVNGIIGSSKVRNNLNLREKIYESAFEKISAIILYTSCIDQLMFSEPRYMWARNNFRMVLLNEERAKDSNFKQSLFRATGMNPTIEKPDVIFLTNGINYENKKIDSDLKLFLSNQDIFL